MEIFKSEVKIVVQFDHIRVTKISFFSNSGDTTVILGSYLGIQIGFWLNYQTGVLKGPPIDPPYPILWPTYEQYGETLLRMMVGGVMIVATRYLFLC
jgi:hypothetical protein